MNFSHDEFLSPNNSSRERWFLEGSAPNDCTFHENQMYDEGSPVHCQHDTLETVGGRPIRAHHILGNISVSYFNENRPTRFPLSFLGVYPSDSDVS
jgi:hypothetical protein